MHIYKYIHTYSHISIDGSMDRCIYIYIYIQMFIYIHRSIDVWMDLYIRTYARTYVYIDPASDRSIDRCIYIYVYTHIHTYIYTYIYIYQEFEHIQFAADEWLLQILDRLKHFCRFQFEGVAGKPGKKTYGLEAWRLLLKQAEAKAKDKTLEINNLDTLHVFAYLGADTEKQKLEILSENLYKSVSGTQKKKAKVQPAASKSKGAKKEKAEEFDPVMSLFD